MGLFGLASDVVCPRDGIADVVGDMVGDGRDDDRFGAEKGVAPVVSARRKIRKNSPVMM